MSHTGSLIIIRLRGGKTRGSFATYLGEYGVFVTRCRLLLRRGRFARVRVVHVHTLPDFLVWAALPLQRRGAKTVLDLHEIFPEFAAAKFSGLVGRTAAAVAKRVERWARRHADLTITVNRPIEALLASRPAKPDETHLVIHNSPDPLHFGTGSPRAHPDVAGPVMRLVYHGTITPMYGLEVAIRGASLARERGTPCHLTIIGAGPDLPRLRGLAAGLPDPDVVTFENPVPVSRVAARLRFFHAGVVPTRLDGMTRFSLSAKLLEYVWLGIPALAARLPSYADYFPPEALWFWTPDSVDDLARAITELAGATPADRARRATLALESALAVAWEGESRKLLRAYEQLLAPAPS